MATEFITPTNREDLIKIQNAVKEASNSLLRTEAERDLIKNIKGDMKEAYGMPPKFFSRLVKTYHAQNFHEQVSEDEVYEDFYETVFQANSSKADSE